MLRHREKAPSQPGRKTPFLEPRHGGPPNVATTYRNLDSIFICHHLSYHGLFVADVGCYDACYVRSTISQSLQGIRAPFGHVLVKLGPASLDDREGKMGGSAQVVAYSNMNDFVWWQNVHQRRNATCLMGRRSLHMLPGHYTGAYHDGIRRETYANTVLTFSRYMHTRQQSRKLKFSRE